MAKRKKTMKDSSLETASFEGLIEEVQSLSESIAPDVDLESEMEDLRVDEPKKEPKKETKKPKELTRFKDPSQRVKLPRSSKWLSNDNITTGDITYIINNNIRPESDFC